MNIKNAAAMIGIAIFGVVAGIAASRYLSESQAYTLYRDSPTGKDLRLHIATFDASESEDYNRENCIIASKLFPAQPGVTVRYWCEKGRYRK